MPLSLTHQLRTLSGRSGERGGRPSGVRDGRRACAPGRRAETGASGVRQYVLCTLLAALALLLVTIAPAAAAISVQGDSIVNRATLDLHSAPQAAASVAVTVVVRTASSIQFLKYAPPASDGTPPAGATLVNVAETWYRTGSAASAPFAAEPSPTPLGASAPLDLSKPVPLVQADSYHAGEPIFVQVTDPDQNLDRLNRDTVLATVTNTTTGETEVLRLTETGPDTGVFVGYLNSTGSAGSGSYNGVVPVAQGNPVAARYTDSADNSDSSTAAVVVDPLGIVFDAATGRPLDGVTVTLWDVDANDYAKVYGDDGSMTNIFPAPTATGKPATVVTGSTPKDTSGRVYAFGPGQFRFPYVKPGHYQLKVTPPTGYRFPSTTAAAAIAALPGGPFTIVDGSRGITFTVDPGPELRIDVPVDPVYGQLWLQKTAGSSQAAIGDAVSFQISVQNGQTDGIAPANSLVVQDLLPPGFRYRKGTTRLIGVTPTPTPMADPTVSADGRTLSFALGDLPAKGIVTFSYVTMVSAGAQLGTATNTASAVSGRLASNIATASVDVRSDFLSTRSLVLGRVYSGSCSDTGGSADQGVAGVRLYLEDGTFVETDKKGMYHFEGVTPTSHVIQLDLDSLPKGYQATPCEQNTRFAGSAYSQFVDVQGGSMWRADFHLSKKSTLAAPGLHDEAGYARAHKGEIDADNAKLAAELHPKPAPPEEAEAEAQPAVTFVNIELTSAIKGDSIEYRALVAGGAEPLRARKLTVTLPDGLSYRPGSSTRDGQPIADPERNGASLGYSLGDSTEAWTSTIAFKVVPEKSAEVGELTVKAQLDFDTAAATGLATPEAENVLKKLKEEQSAAMPDFVLHPHFPSFGAKLSPRDKKELDELVVKLAALDLKSIEVAGHTDNVRVSPRGRKTFKDNVELSRARAKSVADYLTEKLQLDPAMISHVGYGETRPVAPNTTEAGRTDNRRVELTVKTARSFDLQSVEMVKAASAPQKVEIPVTAKAAPAATAPAVPVADKKGAEPKQEDEHEQSGIKEQPGILTPPDGATLIYPINSVRICLPSELTPKLTVDGKVIPADRIGFTLKDPKSGKTIYSYIGVDFGQRGDRIVELDGVDPFGVARFNQKSRVIRSGAIARIEVVSADGNMADGKTPVKMRLQFFDSAGHPIPAAADLQVLEGALKPVKAEDPNTTASTTATTSNLPAAAPAASLLGGSSDSTKAENLHVDLRGDALFQPVTKSGLYRVVLGVGGVKVEAETYVKPVMRDWILVGLGEGTAGYNAVAGHLESARDAGVDDNLYKDGRLAFYAKGTVKGEWLVTASFDSAKKQGATGNGLFQTIDPNTYYTLYGDASQQQYDAASVKKLYLKIERDQFYAMFGDYNTDLTVTELSRYTRKLNGVKTEYHGRNLEVTAFGSETGQAYVKDEIQGDGTSGLYHLSKRRLAINSDKVIIQVRDRFRSEIVISSQELNRFTDYSIDYDAGTLLFKEPVYSKDPNFNPIFIVAEYEVADAGTSALTFGGRAGVKLLDQQLKAGVSYLHEGEVSGKGDSVGVDTTVKIGTGTTIKLEAARSESNFSLANTGGTSGANTTSSSTGGTATSGNAYLAELAQKTAKLDSRVYFRDIGQGFGLGQQQSSEVGTRKYGADAAYKYSDALTLNGTANRQYTLSTGAEGDRVEGKAVYNSGNYGASLGLRYAADTLAGGTTKTSDQLTAGASMLALDKKLTLKIDRDQSIGGNNSADYPTRTTLGAEYKLSEKVSLFAQQEFNQGSSTQGNATRAGFKSNPWQGMAFNSSMERDTTENSERAFALFGLKQSWKINDRWSVDGGVDRNQTIKESYRLNTNAAPASGGEDFTAVSLGADYKEKSWSWSGRGEYRTSTTQDKWGVLSSLLGEPAPGWGWSARLQLFRTEGSGQETVNGDLRLGLVHRPLATRWILLDRLDFLYDSETGTTNTDNRRVVNNLSANVKVNDRSQLSLQYGAKYVLETCNGANVSGFTDVIGVEGRYDLTKKWDVGVRVSLLHTWATSQLADSAGISVGYNLMENAWLSVGYNLTGFSDKDFSSADYTAQGPYVKFRFKFDQNSVKEAAKWLNR